MNRLLTPRSLVAPVLIFFFLLAAVPLLGLAFFNHPAIADDYCFADTVIRFGFWQAQRYYYDGWTGRYFHNFFVHANPLIWHWNGGYHIFPILMVVFMWLANLRLVRQLGRGVLSWKEQIVAASGLAFVCLSSLASISEFVFWYTGLASYGLSSIFMITLLGVLIQHDRQGFGLSGWVLAEAALLLAIIGSSEVSTVLVVSFLVMMALCQLLYRRRIPVVTILLLLVAVVGCYYLFTAPGNAIRINGNPNSRNLAFSIKESLRFSLTYLPRQLLTSTLLPVTLLFLPVAYRLTNVESAARKYFHVHPLLTLAYWLGTLFVLTLLHYWGVGLPPIPRILNVINLVFVFGWLYHVAQAMRWLRPLINRNLFMTEYRWPSVSLAVVWLAVMSLLNPMMRLTWDDLLSGRARRYDRMMEQRYVQMKTSPADVVLMPPLADVPKSLFTEDITTNPEHLWNRCWSSYYQRKGTRLSQNQP